MGCGKHRTNPVGRQAGFSPVTGSEARLGGCARSHDPPMAVAAPVNKPARIRGGCYHACYYANGRSCECACGGESHQAAFRLPRSQPVPVAAGVSVVPESILGDSRPAESAPPPPPGASAVVFGEHEHEVEPEAAVEPAPAPEPEPEAGPAPTRRQVQRAALDRIADGEFTLATWQEQQPDGTFKPRSAVVLTTDEAQARQAVARVLDARRGRKALPVSHIDADGNRVDGPAFMAHSDDLNGMQRMMLRGLARETTRKTPHGVLHPDGTSIMAAASNERRAPEKPLRDRAAGYVRPDCASIRSGADAERVLASHGIAAQLGSNLDDSPEFLQGIASAAIDAHEKFPALRGGRTGLRRIMLSSTLAADDPIRKGMRAETVGQCGYSFLKGNGDMTDHYIVLNDHTEHRKGQLVGVTESYAQEGAYVPAMQSAYGLMSHELGHAISHQRWGRETTRRIHNRTLAARLHDKKQRAGVSGYAAYSADELFAESFAQKHTPGAGGWGVYDADMQAKLAMFEARLNDGQGPDVI